MKKVIDLQDTTTPAQREKTTQSNFWKRRAAANIIAMLPDDLGEAIEVIEETKRLILLA